MYWKFRTEICWYSMSQFGRFKQCIGSLEHKDKMKDKDNNSVLNNVLEV